MHDLGTQAAAKPTMQALCVVWGDRYGSSEINHMFRVATARSSEPLRFVCITDRERPDLDPGIVVREFPPFALPMDQMKLGCRAKLAMFAPGILEPDLPAIFFDMDTMIAGDIAKLARQVRKRRALFMVRNHFVQFWRIQKQIRPLLGQKYYFGNSSVVGFIPRDFQEIYSRFNEEAAAFRASPPKRLFSDERFISYAAMDRLRVWSWSDVVAFHREFMTPSLWVSELLKYLPWITAQRRKLIAITFIGGELKPQKVAGFRKGDEVRIKRSKVWWSFPDITAYWRQALTQDTGAEKVE